MIPSGRARRVLNTTLLAWLLPVLACGFRPDHSPDAPGIVTDTIGGIPHVVNSGPGLWEVEDGAWRVDPTKAVAIGQASGPEVYTFGDVTGVIVANDGHIHIADVQASEIRSFSPAGEFLGRFGRDGEGPGEFRNISGLGWTPGGEIAALDGSLGRISIFDPSWTFLRSFKLERPFTILARGGSVRFDAESRFYDLTQLSTAIGADTAGVVRYSPEGHVQATIVTSAYEPERVVVTRDGLHVAAFSLPFAPRPSTAVAPDGTVYATAGDDYRIRQLDTAGDTLRIIQRTVSPVLVTPAQRDSALADLGERHEQMTGARLRDAPDLPAHHPAIERLRVDDLGFLWVLRGGLDPAGYEWDILDPDGRFLGSLTMSNLNLMYVGEGWVAGVTRDELDVPIVVVLPFERSAPESVPPRAAILR